MLIFTIFMNFNKILTLNALKNNIVTLNLRWFLRLKK